MAGVGVEPPGRGKGGFGLRGAEEEAESVRGEASRAVERCPLLLSENSGRDMCPARQVSRRTSSIYRGFAASDGDSKRQ